VWSLSGSLGFGCSDEAIIRTELPSEPVASPDAGEDEPLYALHAIVFDPDYNATSYVLLTHTFDLNAISLETAREFPGYASIAAVGGKLLVADGETPSITRYAIDDDLRWHEQESLSFAGQGVTAVNAASFERQTFASEHTAYLSFEVTRRVVWDPTRFVIDGVMDDSALSDRDGLLLDSTLNRQARVSDGPVLKPFYYHDADWFSYAPYTSIAVYDRETHREATILEVPCPVLELGNRDEAGNTYLSPWTFGPELALYGQGAPLCVRRITPDGRLDESWSPDLTAWTGGRPVKVLRYLQDGKALGSVLHYEEVTTDFSGGYDEDVAGELEEHWRLWLFDLENETATEVEGIGAMNSGFHWASFDGHALVFVPYEGWGRTRVYEVDSEGEATQRFDTLGRVSEWIRVR